ncbi:ArnT family glycosyltransferase [Roseateles oligotrophus]|uniref:Glycosyltransferase family 39 protein n=1 Tax=Roseateles oligotrophus TaxID=1769250 RepID=A0ABT2YDJ8_9BURK|nr:phospholipid carrier-dependent glycosyltransferase [Roseateles oligotrophus]MCV2368104.1 glycosyltransferase family 39 protein [Roseateles oligotrophus]
MPASSSRSEKDSKGSSHRHWLGLLGLILLLRLLTLSSLPLTDHTEARYAEIARLMLQLNDWISPHITPTEVFWAKPPLSIWGQALSMGIFGVSAWAARLPALLWSCMALGALGWMLRGSVSRQQILAVLVALALSPLFFIAAGAVMTDATLAATALFVQAAWWRVLRSQGAGERRRMARWLGLGLGLGLLAKGPAAAVLTLLPIFMHAAWRQHWPAIRAVAGDFQVWLICLVVALPWYLAAEIKTPGFVEYFVLGEHVMRFLQPGWAGDRYGFAHAQPWGIIWPYTFLAGLPAALILLLRTPYLRVSQGAGALRVQFQQAPDGVDLACYALCIGLAPLLLFSASRNLIWTYAMTALPGLAILAILACPKAWFAHAASWGLGLALLLVYAFAFIFKLPQEAARHSALPLIAAYADACGAQDCRLSYSSKPDYSAYFYTAGRLYAGMPGLASAPAFKVIQMGKNSPLRSNALACNEDQCLLRDSDGGRANAPD